MKLSLSVVLFTLSSMIRQVSIFALSIFMARWLTKDDYGTYLHAQLIMNIAIYSCLLGIPHSIYYFLPKTFERRKLIVTTGLMLLCIAAVVSGTIVLGGEFIANFLNNEKVLALIFIVAAIAFCGVPATILESLMIAAGKVNVLVRVDVIFNSVFFIVIFIPLYLGLSVKDILLATFLFYIVQLLVHAFMIIRLAAQFGKEDQALEEDNPRKLRYSVLSHLRYSVPIGMSQSIFEFSKYADKAIISHYFNPQIYAEYTRGAIDIPMLNTLNNTIDNVIMPKLIEAYEISVDKMIHLWHSAIRLNALIVYPIMVYLIYAADILIPAIYSEAYRDSVPIFQVYTLNLLFRVSTYNVIVRVIGKTQVMIWVATITECVNIFATLLLVHFFGVIGAPIGTILAIAVLAFAYIAIISRLLGLRIGGVMPWRNLFLILLAALSPLLLVHPLRSFEVSAWPKFFTLGLVFALIYWLLFRFLPIVQSSEREILRSLLPKKLKWAV